MYLANVPSVRYAYETTLIPWNHKFFCMKSAFQTRIFLFLPSSGTKVTFRRQFCVFLLEIIIPSPTVSIMLQVKRGVLWQKCRLFHYLFYTFSAAPLSTMQLTVKNMAKSVRNYLIFDIFICKKNAIFARYQNVKYRDRQISRN